VAVNVEQLLYKTPGGIGRYTARLMTLLPRLFPDDEVLAFTAWHRTGAVEAAYRRAGLPAEQDAPAVRLPLPRPVLYDAWHLTGVPKLGWMAPALGSCPLIHAPSVAVPPAGRARLVVNVHDVAPLLYPETFTPRGRRFHRQGIRAAARRADLVITGSQAAADELATYTSIPTERVRVVHNGVDAAPAPPDAVVEAVARYGLAGAPYVLSVGSLEPRKNLRTLVSAFARMPLGDGAGARLALVGPTGWLARGLVDAGDQDRLGDRLRWLGFVGDADLRALYAGARIFALPSLHEGFGLPVLEAMVQATPVVCADIAALREVSAGAARLVPPEDPEAWAATLSELLADDDGLADLAAAGCRRASQFSWETTVRATREVYVEALS
jgi:glycosyltransferase involved in cell wall biosynthesis